MADGELSISLDGELLARLDAHGREEGESREQAAARLLDEALRMEKHPFVFFRDGPAGRRAVLMGGPDVWQVAYLFRDDPLDDEEAVERAAGVAAAELELPHHLMRVAALYYRDHRDEIDGWMRGNDEEADRAYAEWLRTRELQHA